MIYYTMLTVALVTMSVVNVGHAILLLVFDVTTTRGIAGYVHTVAGFLVRLTVSLDDTA